MGYKIRAQFGKNNKINESVNQVGLINNNNSNNTTINHNYHQAKNSDNGATIVVALILSFIALIAILLKYHYLFNYANYFNIGFIVISIGASLRLIYKNDFDRIDLLNVLSIFLALFSYFYHW